MAQVLLFHHIQGLTPGVVAFAAALREAGHQVTTPDLYDGQTFGSMEQGFAHTEAVGNDELDRRADDAAEQLDPALVYAGFSFGVRHAQRLAQTRPEARGALLYQACFPISGPYAFGPWPHGVPVDIHGKSDDEFFAHEGDIDAARELVAAVGPEVGRLFLYPGDQHLFTDSGLPSYDPQASALLLQRTLDFLAQR